LRTELKRTEITRRKKDSPSEAAATRRRSDPKNIEKKITKRNHMTANVPVEIALRPLRILSTLHTASLDDRNENRNLRFQKALDKRHMNRRRTKSQQNHRKTRIPSSVKPATANDCLRNSRGVMH
jgi:hypothetical protein